MALEGKEDEEEAFSHERTQAVSVAAPAPANRKPRIDSETISGEFSMIPGQC